MPRSFSGFRRWSLATIASLGLLGGCTKSDKVHYLGSAELNYYKKSATKIDYPDVHTAKNDAALLTQEPRRLGLPAKDDLWDMPLFEAVRLALENNPVVRNRAQFLRAGTGLLSDSSTVFDPAIIDTETVQGQQGVEAALSEFDAQFSTSMIWGHDERIQNNLFTSGGLAPGSTLLEDTGAFNSRLQKQMANGGQVALNHNWDYQWNNQPGRLFGSTYIGKLEAEYRQPLLAGYGTEFTRIAGPYLRRDPFRATQSLDQGVLIARIRSDISIAEFQASVRNLLKDVEDLYWDLYLAYQVYDGEVIARNSTLQTWREVKGREKAGLPGGGAADESQARDNYFEARARTEQALADVYERETNLRRILGLQVNDGRVIRPSDDPMLAEYHPDWHLSLCEALTRRAELRRQKWQIKSLELQLVAAKNLTRPRLDFVSKYRVNGFGDQLFGEEDYDGRTRQGLQSAYESLTENDQTGWNMGMEFSMPLGFRAAHAQQRNIELRLARARSQLATQELEVSHELSNAFQSMARWNQVMRTNFSRFQASDDRVKAFEADYRAGRLPAVDLLLRAQISRAQANNEYYRSVVEYNKSVAGLHLRKETLLEHNNVQLSEAGWDRAAYQEALRRAWARSHALDGEWALDSEPAPFARPAPGVMQPVGMQSMGVTEPGAVPSGAEPAGPPNQELAPPPSPAPRPGDRKPNPYDSDAAAIPPRSLNVDLGDGAELAPSPPSGSSAPNIPALAPIAPAAISEPTDGAAPSPPQTSNEPFGD